MDFPKHIHKEYRGKNHKWVCVTPSCPQKANTDIANKAWPCRCFSDVFTYVKMSGGDEGSRTPVRKPIHATFSGCIV